MLVKIQTQNLLGVNSQKNSKSCFSSSLFTGKILEENTHFQIQKTINLNQKFPFFQRKRRI
jgi:hypothetical protein